MIHVTIYQNSQKECIGFGTKGHAGYKDEGQDIVCAAASVLMINTVNAIELYTPDDCSVVSDEEAGMLSCQSSVAKRRLVAEDDGPWVGKYGR